MASSNSGGARGGSGVTRVVYDLGTTPGEVRIHFDMKSVPDQLDVHRGGRQVAGTRGFVSGSGTLRIPYDGAEPRSLRLTVTGNTNNSTQWDIWMECP